MCILLGKPLSLHILVFVYSQFTDTIGGFIIFMTFHCLYKIYIKMYSHWAPVAHACNPSYSGGSDQEDSSSKPAQANSP
jgi:hypothetical protein